MRTLACVWLVSLLCVLPVMGLEDDRLVAPAIQVTTPPVMDGDLDEPCWRSAVWLSNFRLLNQPNPATQQTLCALLWDEQALYIGVTCLENALVPAVQKRHLLRADEKARDGNVFRDDCIEVFLAPEPAKVYFHLAVSAAGTQYDGRGVDASWNGDWRAAVKVGNGAWTLEMAAPFRTLSTSSPKEGAQWRFSICREEKPNNENSSLCGMRGSFHEVDQFGSLVFIRAFPAVREIRLAGDAAGRACAALTLAGTPSMQELLIRLEAKNRDTAKVVAQKSWRGKVGVEEKIEVSSAAPVASARLSLLTDGALVLRTLWADISAAVEELPHVVEAKDCEARVLLRGQQVDTVISGQASRKTLTILSGVNLLVIHARATGPNPSVRAYFPDVDGTDFRGWKAHAGFEPPFAAEPEMTGWQAAARVGDGVWSSDTSAKEITLRRILYVPNRRPRNWPMMADFPLPRNTTQVFYPLLEVPPALPLENYCVRLDIPATVRVVTVDEVAGAAGQITRDAVLGNRRCVEVAIENPYQGGIDLSIRWGDAAKTTIAYMTGISVAGTYEWRRVRGVLTSPPNARYVHPLLIKWQNRGTRGAAWFDDLVVRKKGTRQNLLLVGTFDEPWWQEKEHKRSCIVEVMRDGQKTRVCRLRGTEENEKGQDALWVGEPVPIEPNTEYEFEMLAKCEGVYSRFVKPRLALAVRHEGGDLRSDTIRFGFVSDAGYVTELPASVVLMPLPPLLKKRPKESRIIPCYYSDRFNAETSEALMQNVWDSGIGALYGGHSRVSRALQPRGLRVISSFAYNAWQLFPARGWDEQHPDRLSVDYQGKREKHRICPTYALQDGNEFQPLLRDWVRQTVKDCGFDEIDCDYEVPVVDPPTFCFCERCLAAFRRFARLPAGEVLTAESVVKDHRDAWTEFRCRQNAEMIGLLARFIRQIEPRIRVSAYSGFQGKHTREHYGVDWTLLRDHIDEGIAGYNGDRKHLEATAQALAPKPFVAGEMYYLGDRTDEDGPIRREGWKMRLVRAYTNSGCHGVLIWWLPPMDGAAFYETSQAAAIIADFEDFFRRGQRADSKISFASELAAEDFAAFQREDRILLLLFNPRPMPGVVEGVTVRGWAKVSGCRYDDRRGVLDSASIDLTRIEVAPRDVTVILLRQG